MRKTAGIFIALACFIVAGNEVRAEPPSQAAKQYLASWKDGRFAAMYAQLCRESKSFISQGEFIDYYKDFARKSIIQDFEITEIVHTGRTARVYYRLYLTRIGSGESNIISSILDFYDEDHIWKVSR